MEIPKGLKYSKEHEWVAVEDTVAISFKNIVAPGYPATKTL